MLQRYKIQAALAVVLLLVFGFSQISFADETITGVVLESGFTGIVLKSGENTGKYNTGQETAFAPADYRPLKGDTVTLSYYPKTLRNGVEVLAVSTLTLVSKDPNRKELNSPASGIIQEVGVKSIRIEFPDAGQTVAMDIKRGMETDPDGWKPVVGARVEVYFDKVKSRFTNNIVPVISKLKKAD